MPQLHIQTIADNIGGYLYRGKFNADEQLAIMTIVRNADANEEIYVYAYQLDVAFANLMEADDYDETTLKGRRHAASIRQEAYVLMRNVLKQVSTHDQRKKDAEARLALQQRNARLTRGKKIARMSKGFGITNLHYGRDH